MEFTTEQNTEIVLFCPFIIVEFGLMQANISVIEENNNDMGTASGEGLEPSLPRPHLGQSEDDVPEGDKNEGDRC